ncbi:Putative SWI/SNF-related matrix-associated actin-dependent regulator of chromatin subfamily A member 3-like 1, partial [Termitomyces sp. J132]
LLQYSKSMRAKCHGPAPCKGTLMEIGSLRYGLEKSGDFGDTIEWRHWGCVTPPILSDLAAFPVENTTGFAFLSPEDQQKIRLAISIRRIDPADIPDSAKVKTTASASVTTNVQSNQKKRKAEQDSRLAASQAVNMAPKTLTLPSATQLAEDENIEETPDEEIADELYCSMKTNVVGIQYYKGLVGPGEQVLLIREPGNPYDRNAVQVKNISQVQVGHLPRQLVAKLAPLLDNHLVTVEGIINDGNLTGRTGYTLAITLLIYGASNARDILEPRLIWATPRQRGFSSQQSSSTSSRLTATGSTPTPYPHASGTMLSNLEKVDDDGRRSSLLDTLCSNEDILSLPLHPDPPGIKNGSLQVDLLKHQSQALQWCIEREYPALPKKDAEKPVQFWQLRKNGAKTFYYNIATKTPQETAPLLGRGALCADAMTDDIYIKGKTLTMLALILATKDDVPHDFSNTTLIVAPLSVLSNWEKQVYDHCTEGSLSVYVYYNTTRSLSAEELAKYDVVITTYHTVVGEFAETTREQGRKKRKVERSLFDVSWKRIVLDEGHTIRNPKTKIAKAVCGLTAQRRWVLTGTPIINSPRDLGSLLTFLQICRPLDNEEFFKRLLLRPLKDGDPAGAELLRALMSQMCIRRTKEMQDSAGNALVSLPPVEMIIVPVTLTDEARTLYDEVEQASKQRFAQYMGSNANSVMQANILSMLTRMRQLALHPGLVPPRYLEDLRAQGAKEESANCQVTKLTPEEISRLRGLLARAQEDFEECPICFSVLNEARITSCGHMFCLPCITEVISRDPKCPMDRRSLGMGDLYEPPPPTDLTQAVVRREEELDTSGIRGGSSAKIDQLIHLLRLAPSTEKSLVFSQFTSFLDKIAEKLDAEGIPYVQFNGQMSAKRRQETIAKFSGKAKASTSSVLSHRSTNPKVMLLSLKSGAVGLNLTGVEFLSCCSIMWWQQEGIESQAIDRVNRIGQKKPVHVYQLIAENTVESKVLEIQDRKKKLVQQAFSGIKRTETQRQQREARLQGYWIFAQ